MKKLLIALAFCVGITTGVSAQTIESVTFGENAGSLTVQGAAFSGRIAVELLERLYDGNEEERIAYAALGNTSDGGYSHDVRIYDPKGLYSLKINDATADDSSKRFIYMSDKMSADGINTDMENRVNAGDRVGFNTSVRNYTDKDIIVHYTVAYYSAEGALVGADIKNINIAPGQDNIEGAFEIQPIPKAAALRLLFFDSELHPLSGVLEAKINEHHDIYVCNSSANGDGSIQNPYATIEEALAEAESRGAASVIYLRGGTYTTPVSLDGMSDVTICTYSGEKVVFSNSEIIDTALFDTINPSDSIYNRFPAAAAEYIKVVDLTEAGIENAGVIPNVTYGGTETSYDVLTVNNERYVISRYPNDGYTQIYNGSASADSMTINYIYSDGENWVGADKMWIKGFFTNGWSVYSMPAMVEKTSQITSKSDYAFKITTQGTVGDGTAVSGGMPSGRFYVMNLPEEMDSEGEYYIDTDTNKLYIYAGGDFENAKVRLAVNEKNMITANYSENINISGIYFDGIKGMAISGKDCRNLSVFGCEFKNISADCVCLQGSDILVSSNKISNVGAGGIAVSGGVKAQLISSGNIIENNEISNYANDYIVYNPAIGVEGVGAKVLYNKIYDAPHAAIQLGGNEHIIEYNYISDVLKETGDAGAIYCGQNLLGNGNIIRYNYFENIKRVSFTDETGTVIRTTGVDTLVCVYLDDLFSGTEVYGNVMDRIDIGILVGGGSNNVVRDNVIMNATSDGAAIDADNRGSDGKHNVANVVLKMSSIPYKTGVWSFKYPENLALEIESTGDGTIPYRVYPANNVISGNILYNHNNISVAEDVLKHGGTVSGNEFVLSVPDYRCVYNKAGLRQ